jgi:hypothetical protein
MNSQGEMVGFLKAAPSPKKKNLLTKKRLITNGSESHNESKKRTLNMDDDGDENVIFQNSKESKRMKSTEPELLPVTLPRGKKFVKR